MFSQLLSGDQFMPHAVCLLWFPDLLALHAGADALIVLSYTSIPAARFCGLRVSGPRFSGAASLMLGFGRRSAASGRSGTVGVVGVGTTRAPDFAGGNHDGIDERAHCRRDLAPQRLHARAVLALLGRRDLPSGARADLLRADLVLRRL